MRRLILFPLALLIGCAGDAVETGRWIGDVKPVNPGPLCKPSRGLLQIHGGNVLFAPDEGTYVLGGQATADGTLAASKTETGANKDLWESLFEGKWTKDKVTGTYTTPRCKFDVTLSRYRG